MRDQENVLSDVRQLSSRLAWLALLALASMLLMALLMWAFVNRLMRESRERLARSFSPASESSAISEMNTLLAPAAMVTSTFKGDDATGKDSKTL